MNYNSLLVIDTYYPHIDGVVKCVDSYAKNLNMSSKCVVLAPYEASYDDSVFDYKIVRVKSIRIPFIGFSLPIIIGLKRKIKRIIDDNDIRVIHCHSPFLLARCALSVGKKNNIKVIASFHSKFKDDVYNIFHSKIISSIAVKFIISFFNKCDRVYACSESTKNTLISYGYKKDIGILVNGCDFIYPDDDRKLRSYAKKKFNLDNTPTILFIGQQIWQKNIKLVIDTSYELKKLGFKHKVIIVGNGYNSKEIIKYSDSLDMNDTILYTGLISDKRLLQGVILNSDLFFFPSLYDNAPLVLREVSVMKKCSLLLKGSNSSEVIVDNENGFLTCNDSKYCAKKIIELLSDKKKLRSVGDSASKSIGINWSDIIPDIIKEYKA